jgi:DNA-binding MarR family transcriptional regulator
MKLEHLEIYQLAFIANKSSQMVSKLFEQSVHLQIPDWRIIALLLDEDFLSFKEVVERSGMEKSRVSRAHVRLQKAGLIQIAEGPFDKRMILLKLTSKGKEALELVFPKVNDFNNQVLAVLSEEEKAQLKVILTKIRHQF